MNLYLTKKIGYHILQNFSYLIAPHSIIVLSFMIAKPIRDRILCSKNIGQDLCKISVRIVSWKNKCCVKLPINPTDWKYTGIYSSDLAENGQIHRI